MYVAYGWPKVLSTASPDPIVHIKASSGLLLLVSSSHLEVWSIAQHKVRLAQYFRGDGANDLEGHYTQAIWSGDTKTILVLTSAHFLLCFKLSFSSKEIRFGGKESSGVFLGIIDLTSSLKAPFLGGITLTSNFVGNNDVALLGLAKGALHLITWSGEFVDSVDLSEDGKVLPDRLSTKDSNGDLSRSPHKEFLGRACFNFSKLELSVQLNLLIALLEDGRVLICTTSKNGVKKGSDIMPDRWIGVNDAICVSIASEQNLLAVGSKSGAVSLFDLAENATLIRTISLYDWGYSMEDTGAVSCIRWTPDNTAFAVGWQLRGLAVWSSSGCRLMCTIRQSGLNTAFSPVVKPGQDFLRCEPLSGGVACLDWDENAYQLYAIESRTATRMLLFSFGKCCLNRGVSGVSHLRQIICGEDRVLLLQTEDEDELKIQHLIVPQSYISQNWPLLHVSASKDGTHLAMAGRRGLILYDLRSKKWRVFGDVMQEQRMSCKGLLWLGKIVVICNYNNTTKSYELCFYPRYHLDESSLLCRKILLDKPIVMDIWQDYILVTYPPFDVQVFRAKLSGKLSPTKTPILQFVTARELSIMTAKKQPVAMRFLPHRIVQDGKLSSEIDISLPDEVPEHYVDLLPKQPSRCLILRINGELSLLDLDEGSERKLTGDVEHFWVTYKQPDGEANLIEEVSWLAYGHHGMQAWYPSTGEDPYQLQDFLQLDPELEFDREVYPLGLLPYSGVVVGVSQRLSFSPGVDMPCFEPLPQAQTILHCLLRHLLQRGKMDDALQLAKLSAGRPHFSHCLEWLLFTVFDAVVSSQSSGKADWLSPIRWNPSLLLQQACDLIRNFSEYLDVVVSVARKTDGRHWNDLFAAAGKSTELFDECFKRRYYRTAACYILVIEKLEGTPVSQYNALRLLQATLEESMYELAGELVRFLLRSGREIDVVNGEPEQKTNSFLGSFWFRPSQGRDPSANLQTAKSSTVKETSAHIATVKRILETHAGYLMSHKMLRELVAFVKGTQFDLTEFLQSSSGSSARLQDFASALHIIGQKLDMSVLQSRLDAEFLLAHMCTVGFKEWIVVLATLLRRMEVLLDLFRGDPRLWNAYSQTLRLQSHFSEFEDLLCSLEEALEAVV
ncbi:hypothetical protein GOP47_0013402 [Adiantum capillus-veneris]|uniref:RIC1 C-terminal alpha solenoid region domain-containing protein n=1 Tax=Adiantum capillus-veneris TaxID=13818 RepID=A0A9D4UNM7_ADICA|nr:hypothetical protein GOP47_0013402 [Adiantum capillus-veneris]